MVPLPCKGYLFMISMQNAKQNLFIKANLMENQYLINTDISENTTKSTFHYTITMYLMEKLNSGMKYD